LRGQTISLLDVSFFTYITVSVHFADPTFYYVVNCLFVKLYFPGLTTCCQFMTLTPQIDVDILRIQEFSLNLRHEPFDFKGGGTWDFCRDYNIFSCSFNKRKKN
jgi:hypothetical protein